MEKILRIFTKESGSVNQAALLLGSLTLLSQILALFRDRSFAHFIGPSPSLDAYYAAFRVPDLIFISIASLASVTVLIPFIVARMKGDSVTEEAQKYLNNIFTAFFFLMVSVALIAFFLMPYLADLVAPGFAPFYQAKMVLLSRIMLLSPILMGLSNLFGTITQLFHKFFIYSLSPIFYNLGIIAGVVFLYPIFGISGLAMGVALGAIMHFGIQALASHGCGFTPKFSLSINLKEIKAVALTSLPRTLGLAFNNIALVSIIALASFLESGSISVFNFAFNLQSVPLNIIGISYAVAAFPTLAKSFGGGKKEEFKKHLKIAARAIVFWSLPVIFLFIVLRAQIVRVILGSGSFSWDNTRLVAAGLAIFSVSILAQGMITLLSRSYYATGNTKRPLMVNLFCSILIIILSFVFIRFFENWLLFRYFIESLLKVSDIPGTEVLMLPLAYSAGTILNFILQWVFIKRDFMSDEPFIAKTFFQSLGASFFLGLATYLGLNILSPIFGTTTFWGVFLQGFISGIFGIATAVAVLHLLKSEELTDILKILKTKFWRAKIIVPSQEEL
ncbi:MAG: Integral membrane protein MviN [Candidatus Nomurabacteria bacterium GW2011_GWB1_40_7]|uniref:Integral membrane protein MviN n=1 Tax=Candidatus Nomurabacteria bacterium GW2011_GWB1_40_7 TaxID=1618744 RepID=A0A0G0T5E3_9BACT|nr:MAG: Integral membrane protein MviN [Candidatus Nomurabacteria bacterium GW2011_GWB1_40_7]